VLYIDANVCEQDTLYTAASELSEKNKTNPAAKSTLNSAATYSESNLGGRDYLSE
jgi:hypothetical protein